MDSKNKRAIGIFSLVMINFAAIANIRTLPSIAPYGLSMLFFYCIAAIFFLIPSALVSAELASTFPEKGGIYHWVSKAIGGKLGFFAVWLQNSNNFICFPTALSFIASTLAYGMFPSLIDNKIFTILVILFVIWGGTFLTLNGAKLTGIVSTIGGIIGTLIPVFLMVGIGIFWLMHGKPSHIEFSYSALIPDLSSAGSVSLFLGVLLGFAGLEMSANHLQDVVSPQKKYPRAIFISAALILLVSVFGSMAIAIVIPSDEIAMNAGAIQTMTKFFSEIKMLWVMPLISLSMIIGSIAWFCSWVSGPPRALHTALCQHHVPKFISNLNRHNMPTNIMLLQAIFASLLSVLFLFAESVSTAFWMLTVATAQFLLLMYVLMFACAIILKFTHSSAVSGYKIPGGKIGMCVVAGPALLICLAFYIIGFFPPNGISIANKLGYVLTIFLINLGIGVLPCCGLIFNSNKNFNPNKRIKTS